MITHLSDIRELRGRTSVIVERRKEKSASRWWFALYRPVLQRFVHAERKRKAKLHPPTYKISSNFGGVCKNYGFQHLAFTFAFCQCEQVFKCYTTVHVHGHTGRTVIMINVHVTVTKRFSGIRILRRSF